MTVGELYDYAYGEVRSRDGRQNPTLWTYGAEGDMLVAQSPRGAVVEPAPLPEDLVALLESARPRVREGAVAELADLVAGPDPGRALAARVALERMAAEDIPSVAEAARTALGAEGPAAAADTADSFAPARLPRRQRTSPPRPRRPAAGPPAHAGHGAARTSSPPGSPGWRSSPSPLCSSPAASRRPRRARSPSPAPRAASPSARAPCGWPGTTPTR